MNKTSVGLTALALAVFAASNMAASAANIGGGSRPGIARAAAPVAAPVSSGVGFAGAATPSFGFAGGPGFGGGPGFAGGSGFGGALTNSPVFNNGVGFAGTPGFPNGPGLGASPAPGFATGSGFSPGFGFSQPNTGFSNQGFGFGNTGTALAPTSTGVPFNNGPNISPIQPNVITTTSGNILNQNINPNLGLFNSGFFGRGFAFGGGGGWPIYYPTPQPPVYAYPRPTAVVAEPMGGPNPYLLPGEEERKRHPRNSIDTIYRAPIRVPVPSTTGLASAGTKTFARVFNRCESGSTKAKKSKRQSQIARRNACRGS
jgi:hypothetical protein